MTLTTATTCFFATTQRHNPFHTPQTDTRVSSPLANTLMQPLLPLGANRAQALLLSVYLIVTQLTLPRAPATDTLDLEHITAELAEVQNMLDHLQGAARLEGFEKLWQAYLVEDELNLGMSKTAFVSPDIRDMFQQKYLREGTAGIASVFGALERAAHQKQRAQQQNAPTSASAHPTTAPTLRA